MMIKGSKKLPLEANYSKSFSLASVLPTTIYLTLKAPSPVESIEKWQRPASLSTLFPVSPPHTSSLLSLLILMTHYDAPSKVFMLVILLIYGDYSSSCFRCLEREEEVAVVAEKKDVSGGCFDNLSSC